MLAALRIHLRRALILAALALAPVVQDALQSVLQQLTGVECCDDDCSRAPEGCTPAGCAHCACATHPPGLAAEHSVLPLSTLRSGPRAAVRIADPQASGVRAPPFRPPAA